MARRSPALPANNAGSGNYKLEQPPPFLGKTFDLVSDPASDHIVSWNEDGTSFVVWKHDEFSRDLLPQYFKHNNFSSFVRQLNTYGFRKVESDRWEFHQHNFLRGRRDLLINIHRRRPPPQNHNAVANNQQSAIELGHFGGLADELESLKRDKNILMVELVRLRQLQQASDEKQRLMQQRLERTEQRQAQMMQFLSKALQHPEMLQSLVGARQQRFDGSNVQGRKKLKRRAARDDSSESNGGGTDPGNQLVQYQGGAGAGANGVMDPADFLNGFMALDDSGDSAELNRMQPNQLMEVGAALGSMNLERPELANSVWPSTVRIQEHEHPQPAAMPAIPPRQPAAQPAAPRVGSGGNAAALPGTTVPAAASQQPGASGGSPALSLPMPGGGNMGSLLSMDLADLDGSLGAELGGMEDVAGDLFGGPLPTSGPAAAPDAASNYNIDDFNYDLLNSGDVARAPADLPAGEALSTGDAAFWQEFMSSPTLQSNSGSGT